MISNAGSDPLHDYVARIEAAEASKRDAADLVNGVYAQAKAAGLVPALLRQVVKERRLKADRRDAQYAMLNTYRAALGLLADTPLGQAAMPRPFAEQPMHPPRRRGRPRNPTALETAQDLLGK